MARVYLVFRSNHDTLKAESLLTAHAVPCRIVTKPAHIRGDCGLAVRMEADHREAALAALQAGRVRTPAVFVL